MFLRAFQEANRYRISVSGKMFVFLLEGPGCYHSRKASAVTRESVNEDALKTFPFF